jgi:hypothetical protein
MAMDLAVRLEEQIPSEASVSFDNSGFAHTLANYCDAAARASGICLAASKSRKKSRPPGSHYPGDSIGHSIPGLQEPRSPRRPYIPPREHPWRRFRLPGSPPQKAHESTLKETLSGESISSFRGLNHSSLITITL